MGIGYMDRDPTLRTERGMMPAPAADRVPCIVCVLPAPVCP